MSRTSILLLFFFSQFGLWSQTPSGIGFKVTPVSLSFTQLTNATTLPAAQSIAIATITGVTSVVNSVTVSPPVSQWLTVTPPSGRLPVSIKVAVNPTTLPVGIYTETLVVTPDGANPVPFSIPVTLQVLSPPSDLTIAAASLSFTYKLGDPASASQQINLGTTGGLLSWSASVTGASWLSLPVSSGVIFPGFTASLSASVVTADLAPGSYKATIQISTPDALTKQKSIAVTLVIQPGLPVIISTFPAQISVGSGDVNVTINGIRFYKDTVFRANGAAVKGNVLGITAATILLPAALFTAPGNISIVSSNPNPGGGDSTVWQLPASTNGPVIAAMTNAASYSPSSISPGTVVTFFGRGLGPVTLTEFDNTQPIIQNSLAGTRVFFQNTAATILYTSATQVSAIVPYGTPPGATIAVVVEYNSVASPPILIQLATTAPAIFSTSGIGTGQVAAFIVDATTGKMFLNNDKNFGAKGQILIFYATGEGLSGSIIPIDGQIATTPAAIINPAVSVDIGGAPAEILYAGPSPGLVNGILQINAKIPGSATSGKAAPVVLRIGSGTSQVGVTMNLK